MAYIAEETRRDAYAKLFHDLFCHQDWNVGIVEEPIDIFLEPGAQPEVRWFMPAGRGRYLADPFGIVRDGRAYVLCEEFDYRSYKGVIARIELSEDGFPVSRKVAIEMPFHMSYPYVFEWQGDIYCVPETYQAREISLYKANEFPDSWTKVGTLVPDFAGVDPTIFSYAGLWWIACTNQDLGPHSALYLWHARDLHGPWSPHPSNPVKRGLNGTRPAGTPFIHKGHLYRPAMDSSRTYGKRVVINRVRTLTTKEFEEEPVRAVEPFRRGGYRDGVHTLSAFGKFTLVDGLRLVFEKTEFRMALERERQYLLGRLNALSHE